MEKISDAITEAFGNDLICFFNDDNKTKLILRLHIVINPDEELNNTVEKMTDDVFLKCIEVNMLSSMKLLVSKNTE